jgi:hypothetical protein
MSTVFLVVVILFSPAWEIKERVGNLIVTLFKVSIAAQ